LVIIIIAMGTVGYSVYKMFRASFKTNDFENSSIMGKMISQLLFYGISTGILTMIVFLLVIVFSKITIG